MLVAAHINLVTTRNDGAHIKLNVCVKPFKNANVRIKYKVIQMFFFYSKENTLTTAPNKDIHNFLILKKTTKNIKTTAPNKVTQKCLYMLFTKEKNYNRS